jgi:hypothetical protein
MLMDERDDQGPHGSPEEELQRRVLGPSGVSVCDCERVEFVPLTPPDMPNHLIYLFIAPIPGQCIYLSTK